MWQDKLRYLAPGAAAAACLALTPLGASAQQSGVQIQVPNSNNNAQYYQSQNQYRQGQNRNFRNGGIQIHVPQSNHSPVGGQGGFHVNLPFTVPMAGNGNGGVGTSGSRGMAASRGGNMAGGGNQFGNAQSYGGSTYGNASNGGNSGNFGGGMSNGGQTQGQTMGVVTTTPATGGVTNAGTHLGAQASFIDGQQVNQLIGDTVYNMQGQNIGTVNDFIIKNGVVRYAIVESGAAFFGLIPGKQVAVPVSELQFNNQNAHLQLALSRQQFQNLPSYNPNDHGNSTLNGNGATSATGGNSDNY